MNCRMTRPTVWSSKWTKYWGVGIREFGCLMTWARYKLIHLMMSSSDSFTNLETTNLRNKILENEFVYLFLCTNVNVDNDNQFRRFVESKYSWNHLMMISNQCNTFTNDQRHSILSWQFHLHQWFNFIQKPM